MHFNIVPSIFISNPVCFLLRLLDYVSSFQASNIASQYIHNVYSGACFVLHTVLIIDNISIYY